MMVLPSLTVDISPEDLHGMKDLSSYGYAVEAENKMRFRENQERFHENSFIADMLAIKQNVRLSDPRNIRNQLVNTKKQATNQAICTNSTAESRYTPTKPNLEGFNQVSVARQSHCLGKEM